MTSSDVFICCAALIMNWTTSSKRHPCFEARILGYGLTVWNGNLTDFKSSVNMLRENLAKE